MILYGLSTCDTCRKARKALDVAGYDVTFRDVRAEPLTEDEWAPLLAAFGDGLINRRSTTWRGMSEEDRAAPAADLLAKHPTLMKRPVCREGERLSLGWDAAAQSIWKM
ncbi:arsenate reductase family protein [Tropicimonas isoalkanivorans]|uniref:Arsenate reductase, glutaredoxin family n=1 Tax=Tropicimonas isoalkanivorans TaxID=441112 RepID=A0A1I1GJM4_9RHOB|nr:ArsC/Spx/MgsR family protein [Tropicimonas isoalkanivorans]SFC11979.1 Arsenate reductase, glutaredoxin family [Tropicimonas isoalkanivorans]